MIFAVDTQFKQLRKRSLKKIQASAGFEPVTSAIPVQCSTNWPMIRYRIASLKFLPQLFLKKIILKVNVTNQMKVLVEYVLVVVLVCSSEPVDENPKCDCSNENS